MLRLYVGVCMGFLISLVCAVEERAPEHWFLAAFVRDVSSVRAFMPVFSFALLTFVRHVVMWPEILCLHWHYWQYVLHHRFKEIHITWNKEITFLYKTFDIGEWRYSWRSIPESHRSPYCIGYIASVWHFLYLYWLGTFSNDDTERIDRIISWHCAPIMIQINKSNILP